jgi:hypothetical protein
MIIGPSSQYTASRPAANSSAILSALVSTPGAQQPANSRHARVSNVDNRGGHLPIEGKFLGSSTRDFLRCGLALKAPLISSIFVDFRV